MDTHISDILYTHYHGRLQWRGSGKSRCYTHTPLENELLFLMWGDLIVVAPPPLTKISADAHAYYLKFKIFINLEKTSIFFCSSYTFIDIFFSTCFCCLSFMYVSLNFICLFLSLNYFYYSLTFYTIFYVCHYYIAH